MDNFKLGDWSVRPEDLTITRQTTIKLDQKVMDLLCFMASNPARLINRDELLDKVWPNQVVSDDVLNVAISSLRKQLGDSSKKPQYIKTIPRKGYKLIAQVEYSQAATDDSSQRNRALSWLVPILVIGLLFGFIFHSKDTTNLSSVRIAVLPFDYYSSMPDKAYLADGLTEAIINRLVQEKNLKVTSRTSVFEFKDNKQAIPIIGKKLNVDWVLEGSIQIDGEKLQVTAQLIQVDTDEHLWSETYQENLHDLFAIQTEISAQIAKRFNTQGNQIDSPTKVIASDAYSTYLKARYYHHKFELDQAEKHYQESLLHQPDFADAYAGIAQLYNLRAYSGKEKTMDFLKSASRYAIKAYSLDNNSAMTNLNMAISYFYLQRNFAKAEQPFRKAFELNNQDTMIQEWYVGYLLTTKQFDQAKQLISHMRQVSPLLYNKTSLYRALYYAKDFEGALEEVKAISPYMNSDLWVTSASAWIYLAKNDVKNLSDLAPQMLAQYQFSHLETQAFQQKLSAGGISEALKYWLTIAGDKFDDFSKAELLAFAGQYSQALEILQKLEKHSDLRMFRVHIEPAFFPMHQNNDFQQLLKRLNLDSVN